MFHKNKEGSMSADLLLDEVDHPPHANHPERKDRHLSSIIFFSILLILAFFFRFRFPYLPGIQSVATCYQDIQQTIDYYPALRWRIL